MADKTITFTQDVKYESLPPVTYKAGQRVTLRDDLADRWLKRGVATEAAEEEVKPAKAAVEDKPAPAKPYGQPPGSFAASNEADQNRRAAKT